MMVKIILCVSILPILFIMYGMLAGMGREQNKALFGITLWQDAMEEERVRNLVKDYKKELKRLVLFLLVTHFFVYLPKYFSIMMILWMIWLFAVIVLLYIPYIRANKKMREYKAEYQVEHGENPQNHTYVDITAATGEKPKYFQKSTLLASIIGFLPAVLAVILDKTMDVPSAPELWVAEVVLLSMAFVGIVCLWVVHYYNRQPVTVLTRESEVNIQFSRIRKYQWTRCFCALSWLTVIFNGLVLIGFYLNGDYMWGFLLVICILYALIPFGLLGMSCHVIYKQKKKLLQGRELLLSEDDENWIWGMFYYNKNDNRFCVDKKVGVGFTTNMAKPAAIILDIVGIVLIVVTCVGVGVWSVLDEFTPIKLEYENEQLTAIHWKEEYEIEKEEIKSVTLLEELPSMSKTNGTGMDNVYKGNFYSSEYGRKFKVCLNPQEEPILMIETTDGTWYLLGDNDSEQTKEIYQQLK